MLYKELGEKRIGAGVYHLYFKGLEQNDLPVMKFDSYFNERLAVHSDYFKNMDKFMQCVEKNVGASEEAQTTVCQREFKNLRLSAFKDQLQYHYVNRRFFMDSIAYKKGLGYY